MLRTLGFFLDFFLQLILTIGSRDSPPVCLVTCWPWDQCVWWNWLNQKMFRTLGFFLRFFPISVWPLEAEINHQCTLWPWDQCPWLPWDHTNHYKHHTNPYQHITDHSSSSGASKKFLVGGGVVGGLFDYSVYSWSLFNQEPDRLDQEGPWPVHHQARTRTRTRSSTIIPIAIAINYWDFW